MPVASAAGIDAEDGVIWQLDVGLAVQHRTALIDSLNDSDGELGLAVLLSGGVYYDKFFVEGSPFGRYPLTLGYTIEQTDSTRLNLIGLSWFPTISVSAQEQGDRLDGIITRDASFEVGVEYIRRLAKSELRLRALHDSLNRHDGYLFSFDYSRPIFTTEWLILPSWGFSYLSEKSVDYYYGVSANEVTNQRPEYRPGSGWEVTARLYAERPLHKNWTLFGFASYSKFNNAITDSPIVSIDSDTHNIAIGVLWSF